MAILKYPYTNLHELNLDWIIEQLNKEGAVLSVNDKHGIVVLTGEDIKRNSTTPETVAQALSSQGTAIQTVRTQIGTTPLPTTAQSLTGAIAENAQEIADVEDNVIGSTALPTTAQTLTGAIAENTGSIGDNSNSITSINNKIGSTALPTTAQTLTGGIAENANNITTLNTQVSSDFAGLVKRNAGAVNDGESFTIPLAASVSVNEGFALVSLNLSGNALAGCALLYLGRGTGKYKDLVGAMDTNYYSASYSSSGWTITNSSGSQMLYTAIISK